MKKIFTKIARATKICATHAVVVMVLCGVSVTYGNCVQLLDQKVTVNIEDAPLETALKAIEEAAEVKIFYSIDQLGVHDPVSVKVKDRVLRNVLDALLHPYGIKYKVDYKKRAIILKKHTDPPELKQSNIDSPLISSPHGGVFTVTGMVVDALSQQPIAGVNILIKGTTVGTTTDAGGKYSIDAKDGDILVFSFIGYVTYEAEVSGRSVVDVTLVEDTKGLEEVVINAGYWKVTDRERTGNISRVTAQDIKDQPVSNPLMAIQGRMPGVVITQTSGVAGSTMNVQIRGQNSLRTYDASTGVDGNLPLYVIDGVPVSSNRIASRGELLDRIDPLNTLNPDNIESIEILKDADATAIYGSRGANGVVLITTKKGRSGSTDVDIRAYTSVGQVSKMMDMMNTEQYLAMRKEAFSNDGATPGPADYDLNGAWDQNSDTDWQKKLIGGKARFTDVQAAVSGGSANTYFRFGGAFHRETTVFPGDFAYQKATGFLNLSHTSRNDRLNIGLSVNYGRDNNDLFNNNIASYAVTLPPNAPLFDENGELEWEGYTSHDRANPFSYFLTSHISKSHNLISSAVVGYEIIKGLRVTANLGFNDARTDQVVNTPQSALNPAIPGTNRTILTAYASENWIAEPQLTYSGKLGDGKLDVLLGTTWQSNNTSSLIMDGQGFVSDGLLGNIRAASTIVISDNTDSEYRYNALFGRIGYTWMSKYLLNVTARRDGSSRFGTDRQFGNFSAVGAGWIFSDDRNVMKVLPFISFGKLRASFGTTGSDQIGNYGYLSTYSTNSRNYQGVPVLITTALSNPDFAWEVNKKLEMAIDLGFIHNRIQLATSWYRNRSSNQLVGYPLAATTGFSSVQYNLDATVENTGWEFALSTINMVANHLKWTTNFNLTIPKNRLVSYPNLEGSSYANRYVVGEPLNISKRYQYIDVDPQTGLYRVRDIDESGSYTNIDRQAVVDLSRKYYGGIQNIFRIHSFHLNFLLEFVKQNASDYAGVFVSPPGRMSNQLAYVLSKSRWQKEGDDAEMQKFTQVSSTTYSRAASSDRNQTDASFLRLKTVSFAYNFASAWLSRLRIKEARIYVQAQNLFTVTNYFGFNPEYPTLELAPLQVIGGGLELKL